MVLKRKRSESEFSFCTSSPSPSPTKPGASFPAPAAFSLCPAPSLLLPGRTMKRFRNNRPSDAEVYQNTLDLLYSAQRDPTQARSPSPSPSSSPSPQAVNNTTDTPSTACDVRQRSLHSFWRLPPSQTMHSPSPSTEALSTPECDAMDLDGCEGQSHAADEHSTAKGREMRLEDMGWFTRAGAC